MREAYGGGVEAASEREWKEGAGREGSALYKGTQCMHMGRAHDFWRERPWVTPWLLSLGPQGRPV